MLAVALFGAGRMGAIHAANAARHPKLRLKYICDPNAEPARALAERHGATVADEDRIFADDEIGAVIIASSAETHPPLIRRAASSGIAIFCEKPIARLAADVLACLDDVDAAKGRLFMGFNRRFDPSFDLLRRRLAAGEIGRPELLSLTSRDPAPPPIDYIARSGGLFRETMIHDFDVARWLLPDEPVEIFAAASCLVDPAIAAAGSPDTAVATLRTRSGILCVINNSWRATYGYDQRIEVLGSKGMLAADNLRRSTVVSSNDRATSQDLPLDFFIERYAEAYRRELDAFVEQAQSSADLSPNGVDGLQALVIADCAVQSAKENRPVAIPAPRSARYGAQH